MDAPAFTATRLVRPALLTIALYFSIIVIASMATVKPAQASGNVYSRTYLQWYVTSWCVSPNGPWNSIGTSCKAISCSASSMADLISCVSEAAGGGFAVYDRDGQLAGYSGNLFGYTDMAHQHTGCPVHSSGTLDINLNATTCTCIDPYVPDPTQMSCVSGEYTLSLQTLNEMEPSDFTTDSWANVVATVLDAQTFQPKAGATVSINVDVVANSGGHNHDAGRHVSPYTGTLDTTTGITGSDGTFTFTFTAPEVSGTHTFTATCDICTNNPATTQINVMVDGLAPIPSSVFYRFITPNADTNHPDNHNLQPAASAKLAAIAKAYYEATYLLKDGWLPNVMLNDASLNWGGILDCFLTCGNSVPWGPSHKEHRRGSVVDMRARLPGVNDPNNPQADTLLYEDKFIEKALKAGADPYLEGSGNGRHIHLRLFGIPE